MYRGVWLPLALIAVLGLLFAWHPRLSKCAASAWYIALFGFVEVFVWMRAVGPAGRDTEKLLYRFAELLPPLTLAIAGVVLIVFLSKNWTAPPGQRLSWIPAVAILAVGWTIAYFSGGKGGADPKVLSMMDWFNLDESTARTLVIVIRKSLHFMVYGILALSAFRLANPASGRSLALVFGLLIALSLALFDELRQSTATNRTGSGWDVGLDMLGATTFLGVSVLRYGRRTQRNSAPTRLPG